MNLLRIYKNQNPRRATGGLRVQFIHGCLPMKSERNTTKIMKKLAFILLLIPSATFAQDFYAQLNHVRLSNGLPPLERSAKLEKESKSWLKYISRYPGIVHSQKNVTEVLCDTPDNPVNDWLSSKGHRALLLSAKYKKIGFARRGNRYCARLR